MSQEAPKATYVRQIISEKYWDLGSVQYNPTDPWFNPDACIVKAVNDPQHFRAYVTVQWERTDTVAEAVAFVEARLNDPVTLPSGTKEPVGDLAYFIGIGNEEGLTIHRQDLPAIPGEKADTYNAIYNQVAPWIAQNFPHARIVGPELTGGGLGWLGQWMADENGSPPHLSYVSVHPYPDGTSEPAFANGLKQYHFPVIFSEGVCGGSTTWYRSYPNDCVQNTTAKNTYGASLTFEWSSGHVGSHVAADPSNTTLPTISGTPVIGNTLSAQPGTWAGDPTIAYDYQWTRCSGGTCTVIPDATDATYTVQPADVGATLTVTVIADNDLGESAATSASTAPARWGTVGASPYAVAFQGYGTQNLWIYTPATGAFETPEGLNPGSPIASATLSNGQFVVAFQGYGQQNLCIYNASTGAGSCTPDGLNPGSPIAITGLTDGEYAVAFQGYGTQNVWVYTSGAGGFETPEGLMYGSPLAITGLTNGQYAVGFQGYGTQNLFIYTTGSSGFETPEGLMYGSPIAITGLTNGQYAVGFQGFGTQNLFIYTTGSSGFETPEGLNPGSPVAIAGLTSGQYVAGFRGYGQQNLCVYNGASGVGSCTPEGLADGSPIAVAGLANGDYEAAFQGYGTQNLCLYDGASGAGSCTPDGLNPNSPIAISGVPPL